MTDFAFNIQDRGLQYLGATRIEGPLVVVERIRDVGYDEMVEILDANGQPRLGRVLDVSETQAVVQVLEGTTGLSNQTLKARFLGESFRLPVSRQMLGRVFDGLGRPMADRPRFRPTAGMPMECRSIRMRGAIRASSSKPVCRPLTE